MIDRRGFLVGVASVVACVAIAEPADARPPRPAAPTGVQVAVAPDGALTVSWAAVKRAQSYEVEWVRVA